VVVYTIFHPLFEQHLTTAGNAAFVLLAALLAVMAATTVLGVIVCLYVCRRLALCLGLEFFLVPYAFLSLQV
jgi:hypothetical protein